MKISATAKVKMTRAVERAVEKSAPTTLTQAGKYNKRIARSLIKQRKNPNKSSAPGTPPHAHRGKANPGFKRTIDSALAPDKKSVVVGPKLVRAGLSNIARVHEFGGQQKIRDVDPEIYNGPKIGTVAPVTVAHKANADNVVKNDPHNDPRTGRKVVWIRLRTKTQAAHSKRLYRRMARRFLGYKTVGYPKRPYMRPSLELSRPKLAAFWKNSIKK